MSAGADITGPQTKQDTAAYAGQLYSLLESFDGWAQRIVDNGGPTGATLQAAYAAVNSSTAAQDCADLAAFLQAVGVIAQFAKAIQSDGLPLAAGGQTVIDGTVSGYTAQSVTVPVGAKAYVVTDAQWQAQHDSIGVDKSPTVRKLAPLKNF